MIIHIFHSSSSFHFTSLHFTSLHAILHHFTTLHSPFFTSLHFWTFRHDASKTLHFSSLIVTSLTVFLNICDCQGKVASAYVGSWFHSLVVLFKNEYIPMSVLCYLSLILRLRSSLLRYQGPFNLSPVDFHGLKTVIFNINTPSILTFKVSGVRKCSSYIYLI